MTQSTPTIIRDKVEHRNRHVRTWCNSIIKQKNVPQLKSQLIWWHLVPLFFLMKKATTEFEPWKLNRRKTQLHIKLCGTQTDASAQCARNKMKLNSNALQTIDKLKGIPSSIPNAADDSFFQLRNIHLDFFKFRTSVFHYKPITSLFYTYMSFRCLFRGGYDRSISFIYLRKFVEF